MVIESSWGLIEVDSDGKVISVDADVEIRGEHNYLHDIAQVDIPEFKRFLESKGHKYEDTLDVDILAVSYWEKSGEYTDADDNNGWESASKSWRESMYYDILQNQIDKL